MYYIITSTIMISCMKIFQIQILNRICQCNGNFFDYKEDPAIISEISILTNDAMITMHTKKGQPSMALAVAADRGPVRMLLVTSLQVCTGKAAYIVTHAPTNLTGYAILRLSQSFSFIFTRRNIGNIGNFTRCNISTF